MPGAVIFRLKTFMEALLSTHLAASVAKGIDVNVLYSVPYEDCFHNLITSESITHADPTIGQAIQRLSRGKISETCQARGSTLMRY